MDCPCNMQVRESTGISRGAWAGLMHPQQGVQAAARVAGSYGTMFSLGNIHLKVYKLVQHDAAARDVYGRLAFYFGVCA